MNWWKTGFQYTIESSWMNEFSVRVLAASTAHKTIKVLPCIIVNRRNCRVLSLWAEYSYNSRKRRITVAKKRSGKGKCEIRLFFLYLYSKWRSWHQGKIQSISTSSPSSVHHRLPSSMGNSFSVIFIMT